MRVGFTGTQRGMTPQQKVRVQAWLSSHRITEFHHGDCIGADAEAHSMVSPEVVVKHPPVNATKRAYCPGGVTLPEQEYLVRNHSIVDSCDILLATPAQHKEQVRSGTWATIRYARRRSKSLVIFWPS